MRTFMKPAKSAVCRCGRGRIRGGGQKDCYLCHSEANARSRRRVAQSEEARRNSNARRLFNIYVERGTIKKKPCEHIMQDGLPCGCREVLAYHRNYREPLAVGSVSWYCKFHHLQRRGNEVFRYRPDK